MEADDQQAAANSEESPSAVEELAVQAQELAAMVVRFRLGESGGSGHVLITAVCYQSRLNDPDSAGPIAVSSLRTASPAP